jgi:hypothetical protein
MVMNDKKTGESINITSVSMSAASSAAMIGFSATIITLIAACISNSEDSASMIYVLFFYVLAIVFFVFANEFFILSVWNKKNDSTWDTIGSITYGLGHGWIIIGLSLTFDLLINFTMLAYLTITLFLAGYIIYYLLRWKMIKNKEKYIKTRIVARVLMILQIFIGYISIYMLG